MRMLRISLWVALAVAIAVGFLALYLYVAPGKTIRIRVISQLGKIDGEITLCRIAHGTCPDDLQSLTNLSPDCLKDPWGKAFHYKKTRESYELSSVGPDGQLGTADDWEYRF